MASRTCFDKAKFDCLVAKERIYTLVLLIEFIRILSPKRAPPVLLFEGSTDTIAIFLSLKSIKNLLTNSSTKEDLPAPPVPVIPNTGASMASAILCTSAKSSADSSGKFSAADINLAMAVTSLSCR